MARHHPRSPVTGATRPTTGSLLVVALLSHAASAAAPVTEDDPVPDRPNVLLIVADDLGYGDVGCFGGDLPTPAIDALARQGAMLTNWYVAAPVCTPSRYALLTGRHPRRSRGGLGRVLMMFDEDHRSRGLRPGETTLAALLRGAGYRTALIGKWHLGHGDVAHFPTRHGFDRFYGALGGCIDYFTHRYAYVDDWYRDEQRVDEPGYATDLLTDEAVRFITARTGDRPFFLFLSHFAPHYGKSCEGDLAPGTLATQTFGEPRADPVTGRECQPLNTLQARPGDLATLEHLAPVKRRSYAAMVKALDDGVGRVLAALRQTGLEERTIVIFFADNGPDMTASSAGGNGPLRGAKHSLREGGIRVPCIVRWPGRIDPGTTIGQTASALDLLPTLCRLAGADASDLTLDGVDLGDVLLHGATIRRDLFWEHGGRVAFRRGNWKLVGEELYDLRHDPGEQRNVAAEHPAKVDELTAAAGARRRALSADAGREIGSPAR